MNDRLIPTSSVATTLGIGTHDVLLLIRRGSLEARRQVIRGKGKLPRLYVLESSLKTYLESLPDAREPFAAKESPKRQRRISSAQLRKELDAAPKYV